MGGELRIQYALPQSCVRVTGTVTETTDSVLGTTATERDATAVLDVLAGRRDETLRVEAHLLSDSKLSLAFTEDGMLTSLDSSSTGQLGKVVLGVTQLVASAAGVAARVATALPAGLLAAAEEPEDPETAAYAAEHPAEMALRGRYTQLVHDTIEAIAVRSEAALSGPTPELAAELRFLRKQLALLRAELARLDEHYRAWRATKLDTRTTTYEHLLALDLLHRAGTTVAADGAVSFDGDEESTQLVRRVWDELGIAIVLRPHSSGEEAPAGPELVNRVRVRIPRWRHVMIYERREDGTAALREDRPHLVMESACPIAEIDLPQKVLGERETQLRFAPDGALVGIDQAGTSSAAALADALGQLPKGVGDGLTQAKGIVDAVGDLRGAADAQRLAQLQREIKLKRAELAKAGLLATDDSYVELRKLQRDAALAKARTGAGLPADASTS